MERIGPRRIVILTYDGAQSLDVTGPYEVFAGANTRDHQRYVIEVVAPGGGTVTSHTGLGLVTDARLADVDGPVDTFLVAGGDAAGVVAAASDPEVIREVRRIAGTARRIGSVCSGAFVLAAAGLLDGRRATTHWSAVGELAHRFPRVTVECDPIFVRDGNVVTSAGVTAGIDLALALVEEDCGHAVAMAIARQLVVFLKRPGGQAQFSAALAIQSTDRDDIAETQAHVVDHLSADLTVAALAARVAMSPRHFARIFKDATGITPARYVETARLEAARRRLEESDTGVEGIARECGFGSAETMRRAFLRALGLSPTDYRRLHGTRSSAFLTEREAS